MNVETLQRFFMDIKTDLDASKKVEKEEKDRLIASVAYRILGATLAFMTVSPAIHTLVFYVVSPLSSIGYLAVTILGAATAHDLIELGNNRKAQKPSFQGTLYFDSIAGWIATRRASSTGSTERHESSENPSGA